MDLPVGVVVKGEHITAFDLGCDFRVISIGSCVANVSSVRVVHALSRGEGFRPSLRASAQYRMYKNEVLIFDKRAETKQRDDVDRRRDGEEKSFACFS